MKEVERRRCKEMPFDKVFEVDGNECFCHATGEQVRFSELPSDWWNEYIDHNNELHYGR